MFLFWLKFSLASLYQQNRNKSPESVHWSSDNMAPFSLSLILALVSGSPPQTPWKSLHTPHTPLVSHALQPFRCDPTALKFCSALTQEELLLPFKILPSSHLLCETFP